MSHSSAPSANEEKTTAPEPTEERESETQAAVLPPPPTNENAEGSDGGEDRVAPQAKKQKMAPTCEEQRWVLECEQATSLRIPEKFRSLGLDGIWDLASKEDTDLSPTARMWLLLLTIVIECLAAMLK
eukprot:m51a1_g12053 hypothetical protein (128) ;mRNA; f:366-4353